MNLVLAMSPVTSIVIWVFGLVAVIGIAVYIFAFYQSQQLQENASELARELDFALEFPDWTETGIVWRMDGVHSSRRAEIVYGQEPEGWIVRYRIQPSISNRKRKLIRQTLDEMGIGERLRLGEDGFLEARLFTRSVPPADGKAQMEQLARVAVDLEDALQETGSASESEA